MPGSRSHERARVAALTRSRTPDDPVLVAAYRELNVRRAEDHLDAFLTAVPAPTPEDLRRVAERLALASAGGSRP